MIVSTGGGGDLFPAGGGWQLLCPTGFGDEGCGGTSSIEPHIHRNIPLFTLALLH
jgi:hypothetical protein